MMAIRAVAISIWLLHPIWLLHAVVCTEWVHVSNYANTTKLSWTCAGTDHVAIPDLPCMRRYLLLMHPWLHLWLVHGMLLRSWIWIRLGIRLGVGVLLRTWVLCLMTWVASQHRWLMVHHPRQSIWRKAEARENEMSKLYEKIWKGKSKQKTETR